MNKRNHLRKVALIGNYLPRICGIATFTYDLCHALISEFPGTEYVVVPMNDIQEGYNYPEEVRFEVNEQSVADYRKAADFLNFSDCDVVCLQHEFGIFGGKKGSHILALLRELHMPVITTLHTVLGEPSPEHYAVMDQIAKLSSRLVVMSARGKKCLTDRYDIPETKIDFIPHGIPDMPFVDPNFYKDNFGVEGKHVVLTFGLLSPNKGIELVLKALPEVVKEYPDVVFIVLGATHPNLKRLEGETYRLSLERMAYDLGIEKHVIFHNRFVELKELKEFIGAADIYITPYLNPAQSTSGTLAYAFGCGKAVISTPYLHAEELLADGCGVLVPFSDSVAIADGILNLLKNESERHAMRKRAYMLGRDMVWNNVGHLYVDSFHKARSEVRMGKSILIKTLDRKQKGLPEIRLNHLWRLTDATGILQHAHFSLPWFEDGYCLDDNARALALTVLLEELGIQTEEVYRLAIRYAAFTNSAFNPKTKRFRNFMSYDRRWLEESGSDDCQGRAIWALGLCVCRSKRRDFQMWAAQLFEEILPVVNDLRSPRAWAFTLLGINEYCHELTGARFVSQIRETIINRLIELFDNVASDDWVWFEESLTYNNAVMPHALIRSGQETDDKHTVDIGLKALRWLIEVQTAEKGHFCPIGTEGFYHRGKEKARYDQQPIEAYAVSSACLSAYQITRDVYWQDKGRKAFEWFLGRNDLELNLYNPETGGCHDGLHMDRLNQNQGAESTLAFLLALAGRHSVQNEVSLFDGTK